MIIAFPRLLGYAFSFYFITVLLVLACRLRLFTVMLVILTKLSRGFTIAVAVCYGVNIVGFRGDQSWGTVSLPRLALS